MVPPGDEASPGRCVARYHRRNSLEASIVRDISHDIALKGGSEHSKHSNIAMLVVADSQEPESVFVLLDCSSFAYVMS